MIKAFKRANVPSPDFQFISKGEIKNIKCNISYPVIIKPCDISDSSDMMAEEYLDRKEVSVELVKKDSVAHAIQVTDKLTSSFPHFVELGHIESLGFDKNIEEIKCKNKLVI